MQKNFQEVISTRAQLRAVVKEPGRKVSHKAIDHIDDICARFIAASPFVVLATRGRDGGSTSRPRATRLRFIEPGQSVQIENALVESLNGKLRPSRQISDANRLPGNGRMPEPALVLAPPPCQGRGRKPAHP